ncbi:MAG: ferrochelatase [Actinomycetales bacterium]|nr:MAG: ferrochelatase [Actinomycetales bacterium]
MTSTPREAPASDLDPYDGVLVLSFGGPETPAQVMPFLRRVTAGKGVPDERLVSVAEHYLARGGESPLPRLTRELAMAIEAELTRRGAHRSVLTAYRHSSPSVLEALRDAADRGWRRLVVVVTSAYPSYSGCRQYREDLAAGDAAARDEGIELVVDKLAPYAATAAFRGPQARLLCEAVATLSERAEPPERLVVLYVTHSIPETMDELSGPGDGDGHAYLREHLDVAAALTSELAERIGRQPRTRLVFCSRSGPPSQRWLAPDINDALRELAAEGARTAVVVPIGFVCDHMEVIEDLDTQAAATAAELGLRFVRVPTVGVAADFVSGLVDLLVERAAEARGIQPAGPVAASDTWPSLCRTGCCPNLQEHKPALCGRD